MMIYFLNIMGIFQEPQSDSSTNSAHGESSEYFPAHEGFDVVHEQKQS